MRLCDSVRLGRHQIGHEEACHTQGKGRGEAVLDQPWRLGPPFGRGFMLMGDFILHHNELDHWRQPSRIIRARGRDRTASL